jgi:hypothetical protein
VVTMGVTILHHRHPTTESGAGTTPRISPGASMTRGRSHTQVGTGRTDPWLVATPSTSVMQYATARFP